MASLLIHGGAGILALGRIFAWPNYVLDGQASSSRGPRATSPPTPSVPCPAGAGAAAHGRFCPPGAARQCQGRTASRLGRSHKADSPYGLASRRELSLHVT